MVFQWLCRLLTERLGIEPMGYSAEVLGIMPSLSFPGLSFLVPTLIEFPSFLSFGIKAALLAFSLSLHMYVTIGLGISSYFSCSFVGSAKRLRSHIVISTSSHDRNPLHY